MKLCTMTILKLTFPLKIYNTGPLAMLSFFENNFTLMTFIVYQHLFVKKSQMQVQVAKGNDFQSVLKRIVR